MLDKSNVIINMFIFYGIHDIEDNIFNKCSDLINVVFMA